MFNAVKVESVPLKSSFFAAGRADLSATRRRGRIDPHSRRVGVDESASSSMSVSIRRFASVDGLPDLRGSVRDGRIPAACPLLRGGPDSIAKLRRHAERTRRAFLLDGIPALGISMFAALDRAGEDSQGGILSTKLATYRFVHIVPARTIVSAGFWIVPTFSRPHVTVIIKSIDDIPALFDALGPPQLNDKYGETRRRKR
ncbi:hypothetical protein E2F47_09270 [Mycobacterium eburneum]|nr:hypothetical protein [Mycobacterium eburneum]TDH55897.1 hypothetical protein E2F47_09270 [Mycobacterium eburneum]